MAAWIRGFGGFAVQAALILFGAISMLVFARDGFQVFLHDAFNWLIVLGESILGAILDQPAIQQTIEKLLSGVQSWLAGLGISVDLVLQPHWKHAFVLLSLAFSGYAHAFKDFAARSATSVFRYANALVSAFLGGLMAGTVHLAHTGVVAWPLAAFLLFRGLNSLWRCVFEASGLRSRVLAFIMAALWFGGVGLIAMYVLGLENTDVLPGESPSPGLLLIALAVAGVGVWATVFGFGAKRNAVAPQGDAERATPRWLDNPGRKMGLRVLATLGVAASVAGLGQAAWGIAREPSAADAAAPSGVFRDCADCPEMILIPAGTFTMGTTEAQNRRRRRQQQLQAAGLLSEELFAAELPAREIAVPAFAMARSEVTIAQFQAFIDATGYRPSGVCWGLQDGEFSFRERINWRHAGYDQGPDHPVVCVTWWDAQAYARWLSLKTGETYRLPTEAEWEYAARAGTQTQYFWGDDADAGCAFMNGADETAQRTFAMAAVLNCDDGAPYTSPVASYQPNAFGLSDMTGNVFEWVQDCYGAYDPERTDSVAVVTGDCTSRVIRGGSWDVPPDALRSAVRAWITPTERIHNVGFRVARTV
jgi:sulfatase modifying factor 1